MSYLGSGVHNGDIGTVFIITVTEDDVAKDLSGVAAKKILFEKPSGEQLIKEASFTTDGIDGKIQCTMVAGDIDEAGQWIIQAWIQIDETHAFTSDAGTVQVMDSLDNT